jgi:hypothetical protein
MCQTHHKRWFLIYFAVTVNFQSTVFIRAYLMLFINMLVRFRCYLKTPITLHLLTWRPSSLLAAVGEKIAVFPVQKSYRIQEPTVHFITSPRCLCHGAFCMTGQGSRLAFGPTVGPTHFNPYKTLKRRFKPVSWGWIQTEWRTKFI